MLSDIIVHKQLEQLIKDGLYESADLLAQCILAVDTEKPSLVRLYAKVLTKRKQYAKAITYYRALLVLLEKKSNKTAGNQKLQTFAKLEIAKAFQKLKQPKEALRSLLSIPREVRTIPVLLMLGKLFRSQNQWANARTQYGEILQQNPMAIESLVALAQMEVESSALLKAIDVRRIQSHLNTSLDHERTTSKIDTLANARTVQLLQENVIHGHCAAARSKFPETIQYFSSVLQSFPSHLHALQYVAVNHTRRGDTERAKYSFEVLRSMDPFYVHSMDVYGRILQLDGNTTALNKLANDLLNVDQYCPEAWVVMAQYCELKSLANDSAVFMEKAINLAKDTCVDGYSHVVRGELLLSLVRPLPAAHSFCKAFNSIKDYTVYAGLVQCYLKLTKFDEALRYAKEAWGKIRNAKSLTLLGVVLMTTPIGDGNSKARKFLDKALKLEPFCFEAVMAMVDLNISEEKLDDATNMLTKQMEREQKRVECLHAKLGDIAVLTNSLAEAMMHYHSALQVNPRFQPAIDGLELLEKQLHRLKADDESDEDEEILSESGSELDDSFDSFM